MANKETAVIVGVGPGLGAALARRFSSADFIVAIAARDQSKLHAIATAIGPDVHAYCCDVTEEDQVDRLFQAVEQELGTPVSQSTTPALMFVRASWTRLRMILRGAGARPASENFWLGAQPRGSWCPVGAERSFSPEPRPV